MSKHEFAETEVDEFADTLPFEVIEEPAPWLLPREHEEADEDVATVRVPEPALVRGVIVAVVGLVSAVVGYQLDVSWIEPAIALYVVAAPFLLSLWIRSKVSPVKT